MKKAAVVLLVFFGVSAGAWAVYPFPDIYKKFEISLFGGPGSQGIRASTSYADSWNHLSLTSVVERTSMTVDSAASLLSMGAAVGYFFGPNIGIQAAVCRAGSDLKTASDFDFSWTWSPSVGNGSFARAVSWDGSGRVRTTAVGFNAVGRFGGERLEGFISAGPSLFLSSLTAETAFGYGVTRIDAANVQYVDALGVGLEIRDKKWTKLGANFGAGIVYKFNEAWGVFLEGRYFICPAKILTWDLVLGTYDGLFFSDVNPIMTNVPIDQSDVDFIAEARTLSGLKVNPSFFQVLVGIKILLGD